MDPLSITTGIVSLLSGLAALSKQITSFVVVAHGAKADMDAFSKEIASLTPCLEALNRPDLIRYYPDALRPNLVTIIRECDGVAVKMRELLSKLASSSLGRRMQWSLTSRDETDRLRQSLEAHKSALQIAISLVSLSATQSLQKTTSSIRAKTALLPEMRADTAQIAELRREIAALRMDMNLQLVGFSIPMQRFLEESTAYAESVCDDIPGCDGPAISEISGNLRPVSQSSESSTRSSLREVNDPRQLHVHVPDHVLSLRQKDTVCEQQQSLNHVPNDPNPSQASPVTPTSSMERAVLVGDSALEDPFDHGTSASTSESTPDGVTKGYVLAEDFDRNIDNAAEVEILDFPKKELKSWTSDFYHAVDILTAKTLPDHLIPGHRILQLWRWKKLIAEQKLEMQKLMREKPTEVEMGTWRNEQLVALILTRLASFDACKLFLDNQVPDTRNYVRPLSFPHAIVQHAIRLWQLDVAVLLLDYGIKWYPMFEYGLMLKTAVRYSAIGLIPLLLQEARAQSQSITSNDAFLGSCYVIWMAYNKKTKTSLYFDGCDKNRWDRHAQATSFEMNMPLDFLVDTSSYESFVEGYQLYREGRENQIRKALGWTPIDFDARTSEDRGRDASACARYLKFKSTEYANQPWNGYRGHPR